MTISCYLHYEQNMSKNHTSLNETNIIYEVCLRVSKQLTLKHSNIRRITAAFLREQLFAKVFFDLCKLGLCHISDLLLKVLLLRSTHHISNTGFLITTGLKF